MASSAPGSLQSYADASVLNSDSPIDMVAQSDATEDVVSLFSTAFTGSATSPSEPVMSWGMHPYLLKDNNRGGQEWNDAFRFLMQGFASEMEGGTFMGVPNKDKAGFEAGVFIKAFDPTKKNDLVEEVKGGMVLISNFVKHAATGNLPPAFRDLNNVRGFLHTFGKLMGETKAWHKEYGPSGKHIYVSAVGVDPESQGKGLGKRIMQQIIDLSDATGMPAYLECAGVQNRAVYEKCGYKVIGEKLFSSEEVGGGPEDLIIFFMVREPTNNESIRL